MRAAALHDCPIEGCQLQVAADKLMCRRHWALVPAKLGVRVYDTWKRGAGAGTEEHANACQAAIAAVEAHLQEARG